LALVKYQTREMSIEGKIFILTGAIIFCAVAGFILSRLAARFVVFADRVSDRSSHRRPVSRAGGVIFLTLMLLALSLLWQLYGDVVSAPWWTLLLLAAFATGMGLLDDVMGLSPLMKFLGQALIAVLAVILIGPVLSLSLPLLGVVSLPSWLGLGLGVLWMIGFTNVFNFMDGLDGMGAGAGIAGGLALALVFVLLGNIAGFSLALIMVAGLYGFLPVNVSGEGRPKIFMGDAGSHGLGVLLSGAVLAGQFPAVEGQALPLYFVPTLFLPFLLDAVVTFLRRAAQGEKLHQAHKQHLYQRLQQSGLSHRRVSLYYALALIGSGAGAFCLLWLPEDLHWLVPVLVGGVLVLLGGFAQKRLL